MLLQIQNSIIPSLDNRVPTFDTLVNHYGAYLGLVFALLFLIVLLQFFWFNKLLRHKNEEVKRLIAREEELHQRIIKMIDTEIGYKKNKAVQ